VKNNRRLSRSIVAFAGVVAVSAAVATAASARPTPQTAPGDLLDPRTYASDSRLYLVLHASGVQKYRCQADRTWLFTDPEATLYKTTGAPKPVGTHFLNFSTGRPVWQFKGGSSVEAARTQGAPGGTGNIAWLLLQAVATSPGRLGQTTWIQRLARRLLTALTTSPQRSAPAAREENVRSRCQLGSDHRFIVVGVAWGECPSYGKRPPGRG
jgi:Protein of unknown function (DUF3455)